MFIPVPGVAQVIINGSTGSGAFQHQTFWGITPTGGAWTIPDLQVLVNAVFNSLKTAAQAYIGNWNSYNNAIAIDLTDSTLRTATSTAAGWSGTLVTTLLAQSTCVVLSEKINHRYRGGHPRLYLGWGGQSQSTLGTSWIPSYLLSVQNAWSTINANVAAATYSFGSLTGPAVVPNYIYSYSDDPAHHKYKKVRTGLKQVSAVTGYVGRPLFGNIKGRLTP